MDVSLRKGLPAGGAALVRSIEAGSVVVPFWATRFSGGVENQSSVSGASPDGACFRVAISFIS